MPTDPNTAMCFFAAGLLGIYAEFCFPGAVPPGAVGGVLFLLSIAGFVEMAARASGALLMLAGFALLAADAVYHTQWKLAAAGVIFIVAAYPVARRHESAACRIGRRAIGGNCRSATFHRRSSQ